MEGHNDSDDEGYCQSSGTSYVTSIASEIRNGVLLYGRRYATYGKHFYCLPIDEQEQDRNDLQHAKFVLMYDGQLHLAPIVLEPQRILDLGTGSGMWAIDMADRFPPAEVLGFDIAAIQPNWIPPNCQFEIFDVETDWLQAKDSFDFIHGRELLFAIRDWPALISQAYAHLKPGGFLELAATMPLVGCDDSSCPADSSFKKVWELFFHIADAMATDGYAPTIWKQQFISRGFEDVCETLFKIPTNSWPKNKRLKRIGVMERINFSMYATAGFEWGYTELLGGDPKHLQKSLAQSMKEIMDRHIHTYIYFYNVYGRKPKL